MSAADALTSKQLRRIKNRALKQHKQQIEGSAVNVGPSSQAAVAERNVYAEPPLIRQKSSHKQQWNFAVDYNDHFETPLVAYQDIVPFLNHVAKSTGKHPQDLIIYDPYYCQGEMREILLSLGYRNVINRNRDFYSDISAKSIPGMFHVLSCNYVSAV
jgi:hypothetical protein